MTQPGPLLPTNHPTIGTSSSAPAGMCTAPLSASNSRYKTCAAIEMVLRSSAATSAAPKCQRAPPQKALAAEKKHAKHTISIAAQVLYLELDALKGAVHIPAGALDDVPIVGWLVGTDGPGWVVLGRAMGFHVAEAACCFILAKSTQNPEKRMLAMQREQQALLELQRFERIAALERRIFEHAFAAFDQVEQQLGAAVQVKALPAAGETAKAARAVTPKRESGKAFPAEFEMLDASQAGESEAAANGNGKDPFRRIR